MDQPILPAVVVGAGPAGLATSAELRRRGVEHRVLESGVRVGASWARLYDSLRLHTGKHLSALPGAPFPADSPLFPTRELFLDYLERYAREARLPIETGCAALAVDLEEGVWRVSAPGREFRARTLVVATGIISNPTLPQVPGLDGYHGRILHSVDYRRPEPFLGQRVLVVGTGNSAGEIGAELAAAGVQVALSVRSGANVVPLTMLGVPTQYWALPLSRLPRSAQRAVLRGMGRVGSLIRGPSGLPPGRPTDCPDVPLIGFSLVEAIRAGAITLRPGVAGFGADTVRFADGSEEAFDTVLLATGYRATLDFLGRFGTRDDCGFASRRDRVASKEWQGLYFVGQNYDNRGAIYNISLDAREVARRVAGATARTLTTGGPDNSE
jgi:putative flavoprotein involved in K+ transport